MPRYAGTATLVKLSGLDGRFINRGQERRLLEDGVTKFDLTLDKFRGVLRSFPEDESLSFDPEAGRRIQQVLGRHAGKNGRVSRGQFRRTTEVCAIFR